MTICFMTTNWTYRGEEVTFDDIKSYQGFVYIIENTLTGKKYIGKKFIYSLRKVKGKSKRQRSVSDWEKYYGSNEVLKEDVKINGPHFWRREILHLCKTRGETNYREVEEQFLRRVLWDDSYLNDNINGKWYSVNVKKYGTS